MLTRVPSIREGTLGEINCIGMGCNEDTFGNRWIRFNGVQGSVLVRKVKDTSGEMGLELTVYLG